MSEAYKIDNYRNHGDGNIKPIGATPEKNGFNLRYARWMRREFKQLSPIGQRVISAYKAFTNEQGVCWPSGETIADMVGVSLRSLWRAKKALVDLGYIDIIQKGGGSHRPDRIKITLHESRADQKTVTNDDTKQCHPTTLTVTNDDTNSDTGVTLRDQEETKKRPPSVQPLKITPSEEIQTEPISKFRGAEEVVSFRQWEQRAKTTLFAKGEASHRAKCVRRWFSDEGISEKVSCDYINRFGLIRCVEALAEWDLRRKDIKKSYAGAVRFWLENDHGVCVKLEQKIKALTPVKVPQVEEKTNEEKPLDVKKTIASMGEELVGEFAQIIRSSAVNAFEIQHYKKPVHVNITLQRQIAHAYVNHAIFTLGGAV